MTDHEAKVATLLATIDDEAHGIKDCLVAAGELRDALASLGAIGSAVEVLLRALESARDGFDSIVARRHDVTAAS